MATNIPMKPGYYWAKWRIAADGTREGDELTPSDTWEIVQVNMNDDDRPESGEYLSVSVPGVEKTQWRDCFVWGHFVATLEPRHVNPLAAELDIVGQRFAQGDQ